MKMISKIIIFLIYLLFIPSFIFSQNLPVNSKKLDTPISENASFADSDSFKVYMILRDCLDESGRYLKKSSKAYSAMPTVSLNIISENENPYLLIGVTFFLLPIEMTISRTYGEFASAYYFGKAGDELLKASDYIKGDNRLSFKNAGYNLRKCGKYSYLSGGLMAGGIAVSTYSWFNLLGNEDKPNYRTLGRLGLGSILVGRLLRLIPLSYAKSAGGDIISISNLFKTEEQNELFYKAGKNIKNYAKYTYWGYGLQGLGTVLFLASGDNTTMAAWGLGTAIFSWLIFDEIGLNSLKKAGDKFIDLSRLLL